MNNPGMENQDRVPDVAVIVPVYKVEPYLRRCVDSILGQTYSNFTLILVDDGSPDNCGSICDEYTRKDNRVVALHQQNQGLSAARNTGMEWMFAHGLGEWVTFIDSDDWVHPRYLEALMNGAAQTGTDVAISGFGETTGASPEVCEEKLDAAVWEPEALFCEYHIEAVIACGKLYRKRCFESIRYPVGKIHEDEYVTYRILFGLQKVCYIAEPLYAYYRNESSIMGAKWSLRRLDALTAYDNQLAYFMEHQKKDALRFMANSSADLVVYSLYKVKEFYPEEKKIIKQLERRAKQLVRNKDYGGYIDVARRHAITKAVHPRLFALIAKIKH